MATPPSFRGGFQSSLTVAVLVSTISMVGRKLRGGDGVPIHIGAHCIKREFKLNTPACSPEC